MRCSLPHRSRRHRHHHHTHHHHHHHRLCAQTNPHSLSSISVAAAASQPHPPTPMPVSRHLLLRSLGCIALSLLHALPLTWRGIASDASSAALRITRINENRLRKAAAAPAAAPLHLQHSSWGSGLAPLSASLVVCTNPPPTSRRRRRSTRHLQTEFLFLPANPPYVSPAASTHMSRLVLSEPHIGISKPRFFTAFFSRISLSAPSPQKCTKPTYPTLLYIVFFQRCLAAGPAAMGSTQMLSQQQLACWYLVCNFLAEFLPQMYRLLSGC